MVGMVLISHSKKVAEGTADLVRQMAGEVSLAAVGGDADGGTGTDPDAIREAIESLQAREILIFMDLGSAVMSAESVLDMLDDDLRSRVHLVDAPFVEGAFSAGVVASGGSSAGECLEAAEEARTISKLH